LRRASLLQASYVGFLPEMGNIKNRIDPEVSLVVTCGVGHRASVAISMLLREGYKNLYNLLGGITAWKKLDMPLIIGPDEKNTLDKDIINKRATHETIADSSQAKV
jgi:hydroxyacylglutathione hydrolase